MFLTGAKHAVPRSKDAAKVTIVPSRTIPSAAGSVPPDRSAGDPDAAAAGAAL
jgi:hypothetical protein